MDPGLNIDPFIEYFNEKGGRHTLKTRYFRIINEFKEAADKNNESSLYYGEYKYHKSFRKPVDLHWVHPPRMLISQRSCMETTTSFNASAYSQFDAECYKRLKVSLGLRFEVYRLDDYQEYAKTCFTCRLELSHGKIYFRKGFIRTRLPLPLRCGKIYGTSLSRAYFPNPDLNSEYGWSIGAGDQTGNLR